MGSGCGSRPCPRARIPTPWCAGAGPPRLIDPRTQTAYVLVRADEYERLRGLVEEGLDMCQGAVLVERAMWWPGGGSGWYEGHNSFGATQTGTQWAFGAGEITAAPTSAATYVLVANTATWNAVVDVTVLFEDGTAAVKRTFEVLATSRFNVDVAAFFPEAVGKRFGVLVESVAAGGQPAAEIVVEGAVYHNDTNGVVWAAGANALATRLR